jgi:uncharacterized protein (DUF58 family)
MTPRATPLAFAFATLTAWTLFLGILIDRAELLVVAVPLAGALLSGRGIRGAPRFDVRHEVSAERLAEGDRLAVTLTVAAHHPLPLIELLEPVPALIDLQSGSNRIALSLRAGQQVRHNYEFLCPAPASMSELCSCGFRTTRGCGL